MHFHKARSGDSLLFLNIFFLGDLAENTLIKKGLYFTAVELLLNPKCKLI
jgi:hypothetical protein